MYCIHALSHYLAKKGLAPKIKDLVGKLQFTDAQIQKTQNAIEGMNMPAFGSVAGAVDQEMKPLTAEESNSLV